MRRYEIGLVADPTVPEEAHDKLITGLEELIAGGGGEVLKVDRWGRRKLAYPIKKHTDGNYTFILYDAEPAVEHELVRRLKLSDQFIRFLSVRADHEKAPTAEQQELLVATRKEHLRRAAEMESREAARAAGLLDEDEAADTAGSADESAVEVPDEPVADAEVGALGDQEGGEGASPESTPSGDVEKEDE